MSNDIYEQNVQAEIARMQSYVQLINSEDNSLYADIDITSEFVKVAIDRTAVNKPNIERKFRPEVDLISIINFNEMLVSMEILTVSPAPFTQGQGSAIQQGEVA